MQIVQGIEYMNYLKKVPAIMNNGETKVYL